MGKPSQKSCFLITGLPRSGTSSIAQLLDHLGVYFGDRTHFLDTGILKHNPIFYELQWINDLNDAVFAAWGTSYVQDVMPGDEDFARTELEPIAKELGERLRQEFGDRELIGVKDPRLCFTFPLWEKVLREMGYAIKMVVTLRDPSAVMRSNRALMPGRVTRWQRFYARHLLAIRYFTRDLEICRFDYDLLMQNPLEYGKAKAAELGLEMKDPASATRHLSQAHYHQQPDKRGTGDDWVDQIDGQMRDGTLDPQEYLKFRRIASLFTAEFEEQEREISESLKLKDSYIRDVEALNRSGADALAEQQRQVSTMQAKYLSDFHSMVEAKDHHIAKLEIMVRESAAEQQRLSHIIVKLESDLKNSLEEIRVGQVQAAAAEQERSALLARGAELESRATAMAQELADLKARRLVRLMHLLDRVGRNRAAAVQ